MNSSNGLLILPRLRIQNANAISSPMTWGFPSVTALFGFMWNLERKLADLYNEKIDCFYADVNEARSERLPLHFEGLGVICHSFEPQITDGFFHLTRNPLDKDGSTKSIAQEGRAHLDITIVLSATGGVLAQPDDTRQRVADLILHVAESMRIAGGSVVPNLKTSGRRKPSLIANQLDANERDLTFKRLRRSWLPGFALVLRDDLLHQTHNELREKEPDATLLDALLHNSRINYEAIETSKEIDGKVSKQTEWRREKRTGWIVPIPVGYCSLSDIYDNKQVKKTRDDTTPFRFVESIFSLGEWIGAHRIEQIEEILWYPSARDGIYLCENRYTQHTSLFHD